MEPLVSKKTFPSFPEGPSFHPTCCVASEGNVRFIRLNERFQLGSLSDVVHWPLKPLPPFSIGPSKIFTAFHTTAFPSSHSQSEPWRFKQKNTRINELIKLQLRLDFNIKLYFSFAVSQSSRFFCVFFFFWFVFLQLGIVQHTLVNMYFLDIYKTRTLGAPQFCRSCLKRRYALFNYAKILWWF